MQIKKVGVLGCGLMGSGIAQVSATAGYDVTVLEQEQRFLDKGFAGIEKSLAKFAEKGNLKEPAETIRGRLKERPTARPWRIATSWWKRSSKMWKRRRRCSLPSMQS
jgi:3-hydroxyacyl-CoA dehydrogenase